MAGRALHRLVGPIEREARLRVVEGSDRKGLGIMTRIASLFCELTGVWIVFEMTIGAFRHEASEAPHNAPIRASFGCMAGCAFGAQVRTKEREARLAVVELGEVPVGCIVAASTAGDPVGFGELLAVRIQFTVARLAGLLDVEGGGVVTGLEMAGGAGRGEVSARKREGGLCVAREVEGGRGEGGLRMAVGAVRAAGCLGEGAVVVVGVAALARFRCDGRKGLAPFRADERDTNVLILTGRLGVAGRAVQHAVRSDERVARLRFVIEAVAICGQSTVVWQVAQSVPKAPSCSSSWHCAQSFGASANTWLGPSPVWQFVQST